MMKKKNFKNPVDMTLLSCTSMYISGLNRDIRDFRFHMYHHHYSQENHIFHPFHLQTPCDTHGKLMWDFILPLFTFIFSSLLSWNEYLLCVTLHLGTMVSNSHYKRILLLPSFFTHIRKYLNKRLVDGDDRFNFFLYILVHII